jgi:hypothetical protein
VIACRLKHGAIALIVVACSSVAGWAKADTKPLPKPGQALTSAPDHQHHAHDDDAGSTPQSLAERRHLLDLGEASLAAGDIDGARRAFEQAANMAHMAEIELGMLRTQMQAGEYRQALAFAAHTAGVHLDDVEGAVFYAWLLNLGGQVAVADRTIQQAEARVPDHAALRAVRQRWQAGSPLASGDLLKPPGRLAPFSTGVVVDPRAQVVASALLLADGRHALVPRAALPDSGQIWVRNGLGQTVTATMAARKGGHDGAPAPDQALGNVPALALLELGAALPVAGGEIVPPRDPFAGSPAFALDYPLDATGQPAWPVMRAGFLGSPVAGTAATDLRRLGVALPGQGVRGGPVYDQGGRLLGLVLGAGAGASEAADRMIPVSMLRSQFGERFGAQALELRPPQVSADELYERAMKTTLQVLVARP